MRYTLLILLFVSAEIFAQHSLKKMPYPVNTDVYDEICPILSFDESELFFTRVGSPDFNKTIVEGGQDLYEVLSPQMYDAKLRYIYSMISHKSNEDPTSSTFNQDVWYSHYREGEIYNLFHPKHPLNNALPNSICSHFGENNSYVVINQFGESGGVKAGFSIVEKKDDINFTFPVPLIIQDFDKTGSEVNVSMSIDKEYIILAMKGPYTKGDKDLYLSIKGLNGVYSTPKHLGDILNTPYREATPFFSQDKTKLYFSSNRPGGYGGMDIYVCERLDYSFNKWSKPKLLGRPINSDKDDSHPYVQIDENSMLFTSNRDGSSDIFFAKVNRDAELLYEIDINIFIVKGEKREKANAQLYWSEAYEEEFTGFFRVKDGKFRYTFKENIPMQFKAENRGYISDVVFLDPQELQDKGIREMDIELIIEKDKGRIPVFKRPKVKKKVLREDVPKPKEVEVDSLNKDDFIPLELNSTVVLKNILFVKAKPTVLPISFPSLQKLAKTLMKRKDAVIQVEGHTDNVGDPQALMDLSLARANAIREYLLQNGVDPGQVKTKGYGSTRPITRNRTEEEKSKNRRVEIRVLRQKDF